MPANATVFINTWAIGRHSDIWMEPNSLKQEKFLESPGDSEEQTLNLHHLEQVDGCVQGYHLLLLI